MLDIDVLPPYLFQFLSNLNKKEKEKKLSHRFKGEKKKKQKIVEENYLSREFERGERKRGMNLKSEGRGKKEGRAGEGKESPSLEKIRGGGRRIPGPRCRFHTLSFPFFLVFAFGFLI